jgi:hypothetical protein
MFGAQPAHIKVQVPAVLKFLEKLVGRSGQNWALGFGNPSRGTEPKRFVEASWL